MFKDSSHHPMVISLSEKKDIICMINPLRWDETKLGNKTLVKKDPSRKSYYAPVGASSVSGMPEFLSTHFFWHLNNKKAFRKMLIFILNMQKITCFWPQHNI